VFPFDDLRSHSPFFRHAAIILRPIGVTQRRKESKKSGSPAAKWDSMALDPAKLLNHSKVVLSGDIIG
jgi:hypothetical protein